MKAQTILCGIAVILVTAVFAETAHAANRNQTVITVEGMHCKSCVKKMAAKLSEVPGVARAQGNVSESVMIVISEPDETPSPREMWEAREGAGFQPVKISG